MSQRGSAIFCATGASGGKPIRRVRVNLCSLENCVLTCTDLTKIEKPADEFKCWHDTEGLVTVKPACDKPKSEFKYIF